MAILAWTLIVLFVLAGLLGITTIGKPRPIGTPTSAVVGVVVNAMFIVWIALVML